MYSDRKRLFSVMLMVSLFGTPALASGQAPGVHGGTDHPPVVQLATLPRRTRLFRRARGAKVRVIVWRTGQRALGVAARIRAVRESAHPRFPPHDSYARGPPPRPGVDVEAGRR
jgi:hypothetical protein